MVLSTLQHIVMWLVLRVIGFLMKIEISCPTGHLYEQVVIYGRVSDMANSVNNATSALVRQVDLRAPPGAWRCEKPVRAYPHGRKMNIYLSILPW